MAYADKVFENIFNEHLNNLHTAMPCTVITYYPDTFEADLQPVFRRKKDGKTQSYPMINKAPVSRRVVLSPFRTGKCLGCLEPVEIPEHHEPLEEGELVFVVFAERALDHVGTRRHDLTDAVVIGRL